MSLTLAYVPPYANSIGAERWNIAKANLSEDPYKKQKSQQRTWKKNELNNLKKVFDAPSAMTAIVNWLPNNTET